jgi:hypothetical protein
MRRAVFRRKRFAWSLPAALAAVGTSVLILGVCQAQPSPDQQPSHVVIRGECTSCTGIAVSLLTRIGGPADGVGNFSQVVEDDRGRIFLPHDFSGSEVPVYDHTGAAVTKLGRPGRGPGEFLYPFALSHAFDSLYVYDYRARQVSIFDASLEFRRRFPVDLQVFRMVPFPGGVLVASGLRPTRESVGAPFHLLDSDGRWVRSFPDAGGRYRAEEEFLLLRRIQRVTDSTFWTNNPRSYAIELWSLSGSLLRTIERSVAWFPVQPSRARFLPGVEPTPIIRDIWYDGRNHVWVLTHIADARWRDQFVTGRPANEAFNGDLEAYLDSVIEVIDTRRNAVVAYRRFDQYIAAITQHGHLGVYREVNHVPLIEIWSVSLDQR